MTQSKMTHADATTIAIIGGGFCGTMAAVNLARFSDEPLKIVVVNAKRPFGRGTAYGTSRREHLLNVAARNMSAFPDHPHHFFDWLRARSDFDHLSDDELRETFIPRAIYGDYVRSLAETHLQPVHDRFDIDFDLIEAEATDIDWSDRKNLKVSLSNGDSISANSILLATGNQPPAALPSGAPLAFDRRFCTDPWNTEFFDRLPPNGSEIVILGTGLTMVDVIVTLDTLGWEGQVTAVSRNGMLPQSHFRGIAYPDFLPENHESLGLNGLVELIRQQGQQLARISQNPAIAIDKLRPYTQKIWRGLSIDEKTTFLRDYSAQWNVVRHRIAQSIHRLLTDRFDAGTLRVVSGTIESLASNERSIDVHYRTGAGDEQLLSGDFVINCTGPQSRFSNSNSELFRNLLGRGMAADDMDMGVRVDENFAVLDEQNEPLGQIFAIGPPLKGTLWETTAVPELRSQAMRVSQIMLDKMPTAVREEYVLEYCI